MQKYDIYLIAYGGLQNKKDHAWATSMFEIPIFEQNTIIS